MCHHQVNAIKHTYRTMNRHIHIRNTHACFQLPKFQTISIQWQSEIFLAPTFFPARAQTLKLQSNHFASTRTASSMSGSGSGAARPRTRGYVKYSTLDADPAER